MPEILIRKRVTIVEEILHEGGPPPAQPLLRGAALCVIHNPFAGKYVEEIAGFMDDLTPLGIEMARGLLNALGGDPARIQGYGKGAIIGSAGEQEHGALWHVPGGYAMREILGEAKAIVPSAKKVGLDPDDKKHVVKDYRELLDLETDAVYVFPLCRDDFAKVRIIGQGFDKELVTDKVLTKVI